MRKQILIVMCLVGAFRAYAQDTPTPQPGQLKDPRAILAAAAPFYDFDDPALKPWHLKATYQLYDDKGNPAEQGTFEYWWASPEVYRVSWSRPSATRTDWHTAGGRSAYETTGEGLSFFEYKLQSALFSPLPKPADLDPGSIRLDRQEVKLGDVKVPCAMVIPLMPQHGQLQPVALGLFPTYCFDPVVPVLRATYSFGTVAMEFNNLAKVQNRFLAREVLFFEGREKVLTAKVESIEGIAPSDPALIPETDSHLMNSGKVTINGGIAVGMLVKKETPVYPEDAKYAHISGTVVLDAVIGTDGRIHDLRVKEAPWPSLVASALVAVSHWQYKPYLFNGQPVEVQTTVDVIYRLGQ
jgi:TonB family protein